MCVPGAAPAANLAFGMGIYRVQLAGLDTVTRGAADGYRDYSCANGAQLQRGATYTLRVTTSPGADETVRAWLDFDADGQFSAAELVLSSPAARSHQAAFTVPASATLGQPLRLRIAADYALAPVPTACSTPQYSQTEDYRVVVSATALPAPVARFAALDTVSCGSPVAFRDQSLNAPTSWRWRFGDGTASTQQHPTHTYAQPGTYAVSLRVCNPAGCDSLTRTGYVTVLPAGPRPAACQPATTAYCCDFGVRRVRLGTLDHASAGGQTGYEDFTCARRATLTADQSALLQLTTGPAAHDVRVYLDANDDGQFDAAELLYQGLGVISPNTPLSVSATLPGLVYDRPLRLRVWADYAGSPGTTACASPQRGQVEDYTLTVRPNAAAPVAAFVLAYEQLCGPVRVALTNQTTGGATAYAWDFGDGTSSTAAAPPAHAYATPGVYPLSLVVNNAFGSDTLTRLVAVAGNCPSYCTPNGRGASSSAPQHLTRLQLAGLDNRLVRPLATPYFDFTAQYTELVQGRTYVLRGESPPWYFAGQGPWVEVTAWIDYNQDGIMGASEILGTQTTGSPHELSFRVPPRAAAGATRLRVLVAMRNQLVYSHSCTPVNLSASTEDYTVVIVPEPVAPAAGFLARQRTSCNGAVQLQDTSGFSPTVWLWNFGDGGSSIQQHPTHQYTQPGTYTVELTASNAFGSTLVSRASYVTVAALAQGPRPMACRLPTPATCCGYGLARLSIGSFVYANTVAPAAGYIDETCTVPPLQLTAGSVYPLTASFQRGAYTSAYAWLDANDDGVFAPGEVVYNSNSETNTALPRSGPLQVPVGAVTGRPLRLRVLHMSNWDGLSPTSVPDPCRRDEQRAQVRDFAVIVSAAPLSVNPAAGTRADWTFYPNPAHGSITISSPKKGPLTVQIISQIGGVLLEKRIEGFSNNAVLSIAELPSGIYILSLSNHHKKHKLIVE
ncbi:hypothetical protein GCM10023186_17610 [Hymenobacter koreensis]|uniref:PKD domain-containing protein n=2 Tax=Hymenobacter koreensis TaxID=1084523 RepID=A0ABP8IY58_9BACT